MHPSPSNAKYDEKEVGEIHIILQVVNRVKYGLRR